MVKTLAIETSCDDTSLAIISYEGETFNVEKLLAYSQIADHQKYGGVLPEIASRLHSEKIIAILQNLGRDTISQVDFISVTTHPGLPGSLVVGKAVATTLAEYFHKPLVEVNHIDGHIFSILLERKLTDISFPMVILTASGGHNDIYLVTPLQKGGSPDLVGMGGSNITKTPNGLPPTKERSCSRTSPLDPIPSDTPPVRQDETKSKGGRRHIQKLAYSLDDASGEAFDKVSKMLGGPYPGGPRISQQAALGKPNPDYQFKRIFLPQDAEGRYPFSFSGMKSQVSFLLDKISPLQRAPHKAAGKGGKGGSNGSDGASHGLPLPGEGARRADGVDGEKGPKAEKRLSEQQIHDIAYEFQEATIETLAKRLLKIAKEYNAKTVAIAGGVSANNRLIEYIEQHITPLQPGLDSSDKGGSPDLVGTGGSNTDTNSPEFSEPNSLKFLYPAKKIYSTDNGAMIGVAGILQYNQQ